MRRKLVILAIVIVVMGAGWAVYKLSRPKPVFNVYSIETTFSWSDGPDVALVQSSLDKLNSELDAMLERDLPGSRLHYPVVSIGRHRAEVMYLGGEDVPQRVRNELDAYIQKRLPELARQQAAKSGP